MFGVERNSFFETAELAAAINGLRSKEQSAAIEDTLERCNAACTWLAKDGFAASAFRQFDLHKAFYAQLRADFRLTAHAAVRSIAKAADALKINRKAAPVFRLLAAQFYDERIIRFVDGGSVVSLWTMQGRIVVPVASVDPADSSKTCSRCRKIDNRSRPNQATFSCASCGHTEPADLYAARNIRARATITAPLSSPLRACA